MPQWLVVNPNTSETVTQALVHHLSAGTPQGRWHGVTAAFGAPYIADERSYCIAGHAVLDAWERAQAAAPPQGYAGVLVGCFGDPGLEALRSTTPVPVRGLAEASLQVESRFGRKGRSALPSSPAGRHGSPCCSAGAVPKAMRWRRTPMGSASPTSMCCRPPVRS